MKMEEKQIKYDNLHETSHANLLKFIKYNNSLFEHEVHCKQVLDDLLVQKSTIESRVDISELIRNRLEFRDDVQTLFDSLHNSFGFPQPPEWWLSTMFKSRPNQKLEDTLKQIETANVEIRAIESKYTKKPKKTKRTKTLDDEEDEDDDADDEDEEDEDEDAKFEDFETIGEIQGQIEELNLKVEQLRNEQPKVSDFLSFMRMNEKIIEIESKCSTMFKNLVQLKKTIEKTDVSSRKFGILKEQFRMKSDKFVTALPLLVTSGPTLILWISYWFQKITEGKLAEKQLQVDKLGSMLLELQRLRTLVHDVDDDDGKTRNTEIDSIHQIIQIQEKQISTLQQQANNETYERKAGEFVSFIERMQKRRREEDEDEEPDEDEELEDF
jgi:hypothetical protein